MNVNTIRTIDEFFGKLICLFLGLFKTKNKKIDMNTIPKKVLIIKIWGIGSIINITPTIYSLRKKYRDLKVFLLTMNHNSGLYKNNKEIDRIYSLDLTNIFTAAFSIVKSISLLRKQRIDVLIDFEISSNATAILSFLINAKKSVGYRTSKIKDRLYDILVKYQEGQHITKVFKASLNSLNLKAEGIKFIAPHILKKDRDYVDSLLKKEAIDDYVIININASPTALERRLPLEKFKEIAEYILTNYNLRIVLIGSPFELDFVKSFQDNFKKDVFSFAGKTNLFQLFYLIKKSKLLITNDSGPMHLGVIGNTKTVSFFGPETPVKYGPIGAKHVILYNKVDCSPCMHVSNSKKIHCKNNIKCLKSISMQQIKLAVDKQLR